MLTLGAARSCCRRGVRGWGGGVDWPGSGIAQCQVSRRPGRTHDSRLGVGSRDEDTLASRTAVGRFDFPGFSFGFSGRRRGLGGCRFLKKKKIPLLFPPLSLLYLQEHIFPPFLSFLIISASIPSFVSKFCTDTIPLDACDVSLWNFLRDKDAAALTRTHDSRPSQRVFASSSPEKPRAECR